MSITFTDNHTALLAKLAGPIVIPAVGRALLESAEAIAQSAKFSIIDGAISGKGHVASAPGQPPNADTHDLDESIHVGELIETPRQIETAVIADSEHAAYQEFGTSRMMPRPYMAPAAEMHRQDALEAVHGAVIDPLRSGGA